jgi:hypothetical protein
MNRDFNNGMKPARRNCTVNASQEDKEADPNDTGRFCEKCQCMPGGGLFYRPLGLPPAMD